MSEENLYTFENPEYRKTYWHTCSHVMAQAVKRLWPEVQLAIGPSIAEGWYYDFDSPFSFTQEHLDQIEAEMKKICKERLHLERSEKPRPEAIAYMEEKNEPLQGGAYSRPAPGRRHLLLHPGRVHRPVRRPPIWTPPAGSRATPSS